MTAPEGKSEYAINKLWKQFTCAASHCKYNDRKSHCLHEWMELDDHGICIFFKRRQENLANKPIQPTVSTAADLNVSFYRRRKWLLN